MEIIFSTGLGLGETIKRPRICTDRWPQCRYIELVTEIVQKSDSTSPVVVSPAKLALDKTDSLDIREIEFEIANSSDTVIGAQMIVWPHDYIYLRLPQKIESGSVGEGHAWLMAEAFDTSFEKSFTFECDDANRSRFTIPIIRRIAPTVIPLTKIEQNCLE